MTRFAYAQETLADLVKNPEEREKVVRGPIGDRMGGELLPFYVSFGKYDGMAMYRADSKWKLPRSRSRALGYLKYTNKDYAVFRSH